MDAGRWVAKLFLALLTLGALADSIGAGAYVAPALLPLHWLAVRDSRGVAGKVFWSVLAVPCAFMGGWLMFFESAHAESVGMIAAAVVLLAFLATPRRPKRSVPYIARQANDQG